MRNLNEPLENNPEDITADSAVNSERQEENRVISLEERQRAKLETKQTLITNRDLEALRARWTNVQTSFVDEPRRAVKDADELVTSAIQQLSENFRNQRAQLEKQWSSGGQVSTEDLRLCLQQYRMFFDRLLSI